MNVSFYRKGLDSDETSTSTIREGRADFSAHLTSCEFNSLEKTVERFQRSKGMGEDLQLGGGLRGDATAGQHHLLLHPLVMALALRKEVTGSN